MLRQPIKNNDRHRKNITVTIPCPTGGLNLRDNVANMNPNDAIIMDNFIPYETYIEQRPGYREIIETSTLAESLIPYEVADIHELLVGMSGKLYIFNPTSPTPQLKLIKENLINNKWQSTLYKERLFIVNGQDLPQVYDGNEIVNAPFYPISDIPPLNLQSLFLVTIFKNRLFFAQKDSLKLWYTQDAGNISGPLVCFDLSQVATKGGKIAAIANWTQQGGQGQNNLFIVVTNQGECFIYDGTDPSDMEAWALRGIYNIPSVIGINNNTQLAGNVILITKDGYFPLSAVLSVAFASNAVAFSDKINGEFKTLKNSFDLADWQILYLNSKDLMIINVPLNNYKSIQHVMNCRSGAWCKFTGINIKSIAPLGSDVYFCGYDQNKLDGSLKPAIFRLFDGLSDNGKPIMSYCQSAYTDFGYPQLKRWGTLKIIQFSESKINYQINFSVDYSTPISSSDVYNNVIIETPWDQAVWDISHWAQEENIYQSITIINGKPGVKGSIGIRLIKNSSTFKWLSNIITFETEK
ncbi:MAG: hypothetical protein LBD46_07805 [Endomicrobium sp.]|jgi:hypothetical protein|nr:hypothetical protein [Endomicrobium sp.]